MHEFNISFKDLAIAETHFDFLIRETRNAIDESVETIGNMKIDIDSIKQPSMKVMGKVDEFAEQTDAQFKRIKQALEAKKAELIKTEEDHSQYDAAMAEAKKLSEQDLKSEISSYKKSSGSSNPFA